MILIVGLGNPGEKFNNTRHNVGFMVLDVFMQKNNFPEFEFSKKSHALLSENEKIVLVKPQTFMNDSGKTVRELVTNTNPESIVVVQDDIDLVIGSLQIVKERGSAGHKGIESIIQNIGNDNLIRFRIGIANNNQAAKEVVLKKFTKEEQSSIDSVIEKTAQALDYFIEHGLEKTMNEYNR